MRDLCQMAPQENRPRDGASAPGDLRARPAVGVPSPACDVPEAPGSGRADGGGAGDLAQAWFVQLTGCAKPPQWQGPSEVHLKLSAGDEEDEDGPQRFCAGCERLLPLTKDYFYVSRTEKRGWMSRCKECHRALVRESARRLRNAPKVLRAGDFERMGGGQ